MDKRSSENVPGAKRPRSASWQPKSTLLPICESQSNADEKLNKSKEGNGKTKKDRCHDLYERPRNPHMCTDKRHSHGAVVPMNHEPLRKKGGFDKPLENRTRRKSYGDTTGPTKGSLRITRKTTFDNKCVGTTEFEDLIAASVTKSSGNFTKSYKNVTVDTTDLINFRTDGPVNKRDFVEANNAAFTESQVPDEEDGYPVPLPPSKTRAEIYKSVDYHQVEKHVEQALDNLMDSFEDLLEFLLKDLTSEVAKVRAIYCWVLAQKPSWDQKLVPCSTDTPRGFLQCIRQRMASLPELFAVLCRKAAIPCVIIHGISKGTGYDVGDKVTFQKGHTLWNAVFLGSGWHFVHPLAAGNTMNSYTAGHWVLVSDQFYSRGQLKTCDQLINVPDDFYFLTDPDKFIARCFPEKPEWQLLEKPLTKTEFENLPFLQPAFYELELSVKSHPGCIVQTSQGRVVIKLGVPTGKSYQFGCKLYSLRDLKSEGEHDVMLLHNCILHYICAGDAVFDLRFPTVGIYKLELYCQDQDQEKAMNSDWICDYKIVCSDVMLDFKPLPIVPRIGWGPGAALREAGLECLSQNEAVVYQHHDTETTFRLVSLNGDTVDVVATLLSCNHSADELKHNVLIQSEENEVILKVTLPDEGEYALQIFVKDAQDNSNNVCNFLLLRTDVEELSKGMTNNQPVDKAQGAKMPGTSTTIQVKERQVGDEPPKPPTAFKLVSIKSERESGPAPQPQRPNAEQIPSLVKIEKELLETLDFHATQVAKSDHKSLRDLVWDLIFSKNITNELEICRAIYVWLATKDLNAMSFVDVQPDSPEKVLMELQTDKTSYAVVFDTLCSYAGLHSKVIRGYTKGFYYQLGQKFEPGSNRGSWNAVYIHGTWCLIDVNWGARARVSKEELHYRFDEYFFLPDSAQLIYSHLPDDPEWELLEQKITLEEFETMPFLKPPFFKYGIELLSHKTVVIRCRDVITIKIGYPTEKVIELSFNIELETGEKEYKGVYGDMKINRYGMLENIEGVASISLRLPQKESYKLTIFARENTSGNKNTKCEAVCKFKIVQEEVTPIEPESFPPCAGHWGLHRDFFRYGLSTFQQAAIVPIRDGKAQLQFRLPKLMTFKTIMKTNKGSDSEMEGYCLIRIVNKTAYFDIAAPGRGEYGLEIYASDPAMQETSMSKVAQYLIQCKEDVNTVQLHKPFGGYLGARLKFFEHGLNTLSHHDPFILLEKNSVEIKLTTRQEMRVNNELINAETEKEVSDFVFVETKSSVVTFVVSLPAVGLYKFHIYANPASDTSEKLPLVFNYLINCKKITQQPYPFPKTYAGWHYDCNVETPLILNPESGDDVMFRVTVPKALDVAVIANGKWTHLQSSRSGQWEGNVRLAELYGKDVKVKLSAKYDENSTSYATLLEYHI